MFDTEMRYLVTSERWMRDAELQGQQIIGRCHYEVVPEIPERWKTVHRRVLAGSTEACERDVFVRRDGSTEWLQWQLEPWRRGDGSIGGLMMFIQFITERVRMEEAFRASEDRFRSAMHHSPIGMAIVELDGRIAEANPALSRLLGYPVSALCQTDCSRFTHSEDITLDFADMRRLLDRDVDSFSLQKRFIHRAGHVVWAQVSVSLIQTAASVPRHLVYQIEDITQRKAEETAHREAAAKLTLAMDMARLGYWEYDFTSSQFTFDENFYRLLGTTTAREGGRLMSAAEYSRRFIPAEEAAIVEREIARASETVDANYTRQLEHRFKRADGSLGTMAVRFSIQKDWLGRTLRTYGINQDVTDRDRLQQQHRAMESQLRHAQQLEAMGTLISGVGHEFNNLLTGIMGHVQLAEMDLPDGPVMRSCLREATNSCRQASELISRLLAFSQSIEPLITPANFVEVVRSAIDEVHATLTPLIELRVNLAAECPPVRCNATQITQAILHVVANSVQAMAHGGGVLEISLRHATPDAGWRSEHPQVASHHTVHLSLRDSGVGMSATTRGRIFDPFFTTKSPGQAHGLGLHLVYGIVKRHGGAVAVESAQGRGTTVHLLFPGLG